ncbi:MAG: hypothetical protein EOO47_00005 [Flavobacterium sp.]|nr:MAG: hypothetical protein EOO47_00005 [Flavobacterium sp.]
MATNENNPKGGEQVILGVSLDTSQAEQQGADLGNSLKGVGKNIGTESVKSFKQQLKEAKDEALKLQLAGKQGTAEWTAQVKIIAQLKDEMDVLGRTTQAYDPGNKFQSLAKVASLGASSIGGLTGAMTLFGVSTETANESIAKLQSIQSIVGLLDAWGDSVDFLQPFLQRLGLVKVATTEVTVATQTSTVATNANATATEGLTVAQKSAAVASKALKVALASIGIGLLITAVAYLVSNWDSLKKSVTDLFPSLKGAGDMFTKIKNIAFGVGNTIIQYLIAPFKALGKILSGDFKGALLEMQKGLNVVDNFKAGKLQGEVNDFKAKNKLILENEIATGEQRLKVLKASGASTEALERSLYNKKKALYQDDAEKFKEVINDKEVFEAGVIKAQADKVKAAAEKAKQEAKAKADKNKADREAELKEYQKYVEDAKKISNQSNKNERQKAEDDIRLRYAKELELASKLGKSKVEIEKAQAAELLIINKKYADDVAAYLATKDAEKLSNFDRQRKTINDEIEKLKLTANTEDKLKLDASKGLQLSNIDNLETATNDSATANNNLNAVKGANASNEADTVEKARQKILNIRNAEINAEVEAFNLKKLQLAGQKNEIENLEREHSQKLIDINKATTDANIEISKREAEAKISNLNAVANMLGNAAALFGQNTIAYKALAIAQAGIDTYLSAQSAYKSMVGIPVVGPALATAAAGIAVVGGLANIKKIVSVKVPKATGGISTGVSGRSDFTAPVINSTVLKQSESGISNLTSTVEKKNENIRAFIVEDDLNKKNQKTDTINKMSSL